MASRCQLYLSIPAAFDSDASLIEQALAAARSPSLLAVGHGAADRLAAMVRAAHRQNAIVLTDNLEMLANVQGFDGLHVAQQCEAVKATRDRLGADAVIGADCLLSRHEALTLAEAGADYIAFGRGEDNAADDLAEMIGWWSGLIELPCAVWLPADAPAETWRTLAAAGADFLIPGPEIWDQPQAVCDRLEQLAALCE